MKEAFEQFATGAFGVEELRRKLYKKGFHCERSTFPVLLRNQAYIGRVCVPAFKGEPAYYTRAVHEPLVSEALFYRVQDILESRKPNRPTRNTLKPEFMLRGHLVCQRCGRSLTGSASTGRNGKYCYYHCQAGCKERFRADAAHMALQRYLSACRLSRAAIDVFTECLVDLFECSARDIAREIHVIDVAIARNQKRLDNARQLRLDGEFDSVEYQATKANLENAISALIHTKYTVGQPLENFRTYAADAAIRARDLGTFYDGLKDLSARDVLIGSVFPEKLTFLGDSYRAPLVNKAVGLICSPDSPNDGRAAL